MGKTSDELQREIAQHRERMERRVDDLQNRVKTDVDDASTAVSEKVSATKISEYVEQRPLTTLAGAFGAGIVLGLATPGGGASSRSSGRPQRAYDSGYSNGGSGGGGPLDGFLAGLVGNASGMLSGKLQDEFQSLLDGMFDKTKSRPASTATVDAPAYAEPARMNGAPNGYRPAVTPGSGDPDFLTKGGK